MELTLTLNNSFTAPLDAENSQKFELDYSFDNFSPNQNLTDDLNLSFRCTGNQYDVVNYVRNSIDTKGINTAILWSVTDRSGVSFGNGYIDLMSPETFFDDEINGKYELKFVPIVNSVFELMRKTELRSLQWNKNDYRIIETIKNSVPDGTEAAILSVSLYVIQKALQEAVYNLSKQAADLLGGITGGLVAIAKFASSVAYYGLLVAQMYKLLQQLSDAIFSKVKTYYCMIVKDIFEKACASIGYKFDSSLFDGIMKDLTHLTNTDEAPALKGLPKNNPIPDKNLLNYFEDWGKFFYAKPKVNYRTKTIHFENVFTYIKNPGAVRLNDLYRSKSYTSNFSELNKKIQCIPGGTPVYFQKKSSIESGF